MHCLILRKRRTWQKLPNLPSLSWNLRQKQIQQQASIISSFPIGTLPLVEVSVLLHITVKVRARVKSTTAIAIKIKIYTTIQSIMSKYPCNVLKRPLFISVNHYRPIIDLDLRDDRGTFHGSFHFSYSCLYLYSSQRPYVTASTTVVHWP